LTIQEEDIRKIIIIDLGQVGDVIMSFPALIALRKRFASAELVAIAGKTPAALISDLGLVDKVITIDRYGLLRGPKLSSISKIFGIVRQVRNEKPDLVVDLHSLYESNLLGYLSAAKYRLFANRRNRSLDFLSNVRPRPPLYDPSKHLSTIYLDVLQPLGITDAETNITISPPKDMVAKLKAKLGAENSDLVPQIGILTGAGNPSRKWPLENFVELAKRIQSTHEAKIFVFLGPEESSEESMIRREFDSVAAIVPDLSLIELTATFSTLDLVIGNDTGTTHLAAVSGPRVVMISDERAPDTFTPLGTRSETVRTDVIEKITVEDVWSALDLFKKRSEDEGQPKEDQPNERQ
jgi:ADP-heptose:LPS heptosyltransferase